MWEIYYSPGIVLDSWDITVNKTEQMPYSHGVADSLDDSRKDPTSWYSPPWMWAGPSDLCLRQYGNSVNSETRCKHNVLPS